MLSRREASRKTVDDVVTMKTDPSEMKTELSMEAAEGGL